MSEYKIWLAKFLTRIFLVIGVLILIGLLGAGEMNDKKVAVVKLEGVIEDSSQVISALYKQVNDESIKAIVLRVDSPGGAVAPSEEIYEAVKKLNLKAGDTIVFGKYAGDDIEFNREDLKFLKHDEVLAIVKK